MENSNKLAFLDYMGRITDPRKPYNQLHVFLDIVAIAVLATLCGAGFARSMDIIFNVRNKFL